MNKIHIRRLLKLAAHLEKPARKRLHKKFDFGCVSSGTLEEGRRFCGTAGCALGECPAVFPNQWMVRRQVGFLIGTNLYEFLVGLRNYRYTNTFSDAELFFGLIPSESRHLFMPNRQQPNCYGGKILNESATARQVARNIRAFLKLKEKGC